MLSVAIIRFKSALLSLSRVGCVGAVPSGETLASCALDRIALHALGCWAATVATNVAGNEAVPH